jgi:hypothetical protein
MGCQSLTFLPVLGHYCVSHVYTVMSRKANAVNDLLPVSRDDHASTFSIYGHQNEPKTLKIRKLAEPLCAPALEFFTLFATALNEISYWDPFSIGRHSANQIWNFLDWVIEYRDRYYHSIASNSGTDNRVSLGVPKAVKRALMLPYRRF